MAFSNLIAVFMNFRSAATLHAAGAASAESPGLAWLYGLALMPVLTDVLERGGPPRSPREWLTEVVVGLVIVALVRRVRQEHLAVLALARRDALTGLWNRRAFEEAIEDECARAHRTGQPLSLVYIDLDQFKRVNDSEGHERGDALLRQVGTALRHAARARVDRGFRLGGDEFAMLLPASTAESAQAVVQRVRQHCVHADPAWSGGSLGLSAGIVEFDPQESPEDLIRRADAAMYQMKSARRA